MVCDQGGPRAANWQKMDFLFGSKKETIQTFTEHDNNQYSPLVVIGGVHVYPEGFGIIVVVGLLMFFHVRRNYRVEKPKRFYE